MSLIGELKRRNVLRVGFAYLAGAWLVIQIAETLFPAFGLGDAAVRLVVIVLAIGLLPALIFAWVFELTPEGLMRESEVVRDSSVSAETGKRLDRAIIVVLGIAVVYFATDKFLLSPQREAGLADSATPVVDEEAQVEQQAADPRPQQSVAVLPFVNLSGDKDNEYFSDGLTETLMHMLGQISELRVSARTSCFAFKGKNVDVREIGSALGVANVLEGSVQKAGDRIRITAQLVRADDGFHLWSNSYDRTLDDIFAIQDEIATRISGNLEVTLTDSQKARLTERAALNADAYERYLKGRYFWNQRTNEGYRNAIEMFRQAIDLEPNYARAYVGLADAQAFVEVPGVSSIEQYETAFGTISKALEIDAELGEAHATMGLLLQNKDWDFAGAERQYREAIELSPSYASAFHWYGELLTQLQRIDEALGMLRQASALDPLSSAIRSDIGLTRYFARDFDSAIDALQQSIAADPSFGRTYHYLAKVLAHVGRYDEAVLAQQKAWVLSGDDPQEVDRRVHALEAALKESGGRAYWRQQLQLAEASRGPDWPVDVAELYVRLGERDRALALLEEGLTARKFAMLFLKVEPAWDDLRDDPRFQNLVRQIGFASASALLADAAVPGVGPRRFAPGEAEITVRR